MFRQWNYENKLRKLQKAKRLVVSKIENRDASLTANQARELTHSEWDIALLITSYLEEEAELYRLPLPAGYDTPDNEYWRTDERNGKKMLTREGVQVLDANIHAAITRRWERKARAYPKSRLSIEIASGWDVY